MAVIGPRIVVAGTLGLPVDGQLDQACESLLAFPAADASNDDENADSQNVNCEGFVLSLIAHLHVDLSLKNVASGLLEHLAAKQAFFSLNTERTAGVGAGFAGKC